MKQCIILFTQRKENNNFVSISLLTITYSSTDNFLSPINEMKIIKSKFHDEKQNLKAHKCIWKFEVASFIPNSTHLPVMQHAQNFIGTWGKYSGSEIVSGTYSGAEILPSRK